MSNDDASRLYPLPFPTLASIVSPPAALPGPPTDAELIAGVTLTDAELDELEQSFEIPGAVVATPQPQPVVAPPLPLQIEPEAPPVYLPPDPEPPVLPTAAAPRPGWLLPDLMRTRETHMLSGSSGAGKTSWLGWFIAQLLTADSVFDRPIQRPPFIAYIAGDRAIDDARDKFIKAGWLEPVTWGIVEAASDVETQLKKIVDGAPSDPQSFPMLRSALKAVAIKHKLPGGTLPPDSLIILDSMSTILNIEPSGSYLRNVAAPMALLNRYCHQAKLTVLLVHHGGKQLADKSQRYARAQDRILGSMALLGFTSTQIQLTEPELTGDPTQGLYELTVVSHSAKAFGVHFDRHPDTGVFQPVIGSLPAVPDAQSQDKAAMEAYVKVVPTRGLKARILEILKTLAPEEAANVPKLQDQLECRERGRTNFFKAIKGLIDDGFVEEVIDPGNVRWIRLKPTADPS